MTSWGRREKGILPGRIAPLESPGRQAFESCIFVGAGPVRELLLLGRRPCLGAGKQPLHKQPLHLFSKLSLLRSHTGALLNELYKLAYNVQTKGRMLTVQRECCSAFDLFPEGRGMSNTLQAAQCRMKAVSNCCDTFLISGATG